MPTFLYESIGAAGEKRTGQIETESRLHALHRLADQGCHLLSLEETITHRKRKPRRLTLKSLAFFSRQCAGLLKAGLPLLKALQILENQGGTGTLSEICNTIRNYVKEGNSFSEALSQRSDSFSKLYISMIRTGETGGTLDETLRHLTSLLERELDLRGRVRSALVYPGMMVGVGCATVFLLLSFVIPQVTLLFQNAGRQLPLPTQLLLNLSSFFHSFWWGLLLSVFGLVAIMRFFIKTATGKSLTHHWLLHLPLLGTFLLHVEMSRMARVLGMLLGHGIPMLKALEVTAAALSTTVLSQSVHDIAARIKQGEILSAQMQQQRYFPFLMIDVVAVGEQSGSLDSALLNLAEAYDQEIERLVRTLVSLMEPILIVAVGGAVGFIVSALLLPIFDLNEVMQ